MLVRNSSPGSLHLHAVTRSIYMFQPLMTQLGCIWPRGHKHPHLNYQIMLNLSSLPWLQRIFILHFRLYFSPKFLCQQGSFQVKPSLKAWLHVNQTTKHIVRLNAKGLCSKQKTVKDSCMTSVTTSQRHEKYTPKEQRNEKWAPIQNETSRELWFSRSI